MQLHFPSLVDSARSAQRSSWGPRMGPQGNAAGSREEAAYQRFRLTSIDFRARRLDDLGPLVGLAADERRKLLRCVARCLRSLGEKLLSGCGRLQPFVDFGVQTRDDCGRSSRGRENAEPRARLETG